MDELEIIAATVREHRPVFGHGSPYERCLCGRTPARGQAEHTAEEIVQALTDAGMGVFLFERLGLLEDER